MDRDWTRERHAMVDEQLLRRGIRDAATLEAMREIPRHLFVSEQVRMHAYDDGPLPIGQGQTISQPYIVALMTQAAEVTPQSVVLEIGTGSGYQAAILARMVKTVYTIERIQPLADHAEQLFKELGYTNIHVKCGDGTLGWPEKGPFDAILVTAGAPVVPESFLDQLTVGGRVIIPVGDSISQELYRLRKTPVGIYSRELLEFVRFVPLIGKQGWQK